MKTNKTTPKNLTNVVSGFDAIKTMREIRDKISLEIMNMTYEEERKYLDELLCQKTNSAK